MYQEHKEALMLEDVSVELPVFVWGVVGFELSSLFEPIIGALDDDEDTWSDHDKLRVEAVSRFLGTVRHHLESIGIRPENLED